MASFPNYILSNRPEGKVLTREQAARSLVVTNLAPQTTDEDIVIYFQRQRNGGGEINHVHIPSKGTAVVTFDENEVAARVLGHHHTLDGSNLKLCRFIPTEARQVFKEVKARVNSESIHLLNRHSKGILEIVKENSGVELEYRKDTEDVIMTGTFDQIEAAHKLFQCLVSQQVKREKVTSYGYVAEPNIFEVQPLFMKLLKRVLNKKLREIEEKSCVKIRCDENMSQVFIRPSKIIAKQKHFQEGCDAFIDLYQKFIPNIGREEVNPPKDADTAFIQEAVATAEAENPMIIEKTEGLLVVYAEKKSMKRSVQSLKEGLGLMVDQESKRRQGNKRFDARAENKTPQQGQVSMTQHLEHGLGNGVKLSLYQGDITDEAVDAIVNAANERLQHAGGVAAAIVSKGGHQIQEESNRLIKRYGPLNVGEADYTSGGSLSCRHVIHTVGPEWFRHGKDMSKSLLRGACLESLRLAVQLNVSSIALTAISSGIFGMPKDICAEVMFDSIEEFSVNEDAKLSTLRDIRIVIIDDPTLTVFQEEFVKRYMAQEASQETLERSFYQQEKTSRNPNSEPKTEKPNLNDSSLVTSETQTGSKTFSAGRREQNETFASSSVPEGAGESIHSSMPDSIRDVSLSKRDNEGEMKDTLTTGQLDPVKGDEKTFYSASPGKARGKQPKGKLAPNFHSSPGKDTSVTQNRSNSRKDVADTGRQGSIAVNNATTSTLPPAPAISQEEKPLARLEMTSDQQSNAGDSPKHKDAEGQNEPGGEVVTSTKQIQDSEDTKQNVDSENSQIDSTKGNTTDQKTKSESNFTTKATASEETFKPSPDTFKEGEQEVLDSKTEMSSQDPVAMSPTTRIKQSAMENSPQESSSTSLPYSSSDHSISPHGVTKGEKDKVVGTQKDDEESGGQNNVAGSPSFLEAQTGHREMEQRCLMCMNFKTDLSSPSQCGGSHYYYNPCKDSLGSACICDHCRKEDLPQGNQPIGIMSWIEVTDSSLPGYEHCGIIVMHFQFDEGIQGKKHPNPGQPYKALRTTAYLPFNSDGKEVCSLLRNAFDAGLLFVIGKSPATGEENKIICNGVELKTNQSGGPASYGYPDASYIDRVKRQMAEKGITQTRE